jgi:hypothetical protein
MMREYKQKIAQGSSTSGATTAKTTLTTTTSMSWAKILWKGNHPGSSIARIPAMTVRCVRRVAFGNMKYRSTA